MLHEQNPVPIVVLSANCSKQEECEALRAGAVKYLGKPLDMGQCLAHAQAIMRRYMLGAGQGRSYILAAGNGLKIDLRAHRVFGGSERIDLTPTQYRLICTLADHMRAVHTKEQMYASGKRICGVRHNAIGTEVLLKIRLVAVETDCPYSKMFFCECFTKKLWHGLYLQPDIPIKKC